VISTKMPLAGIGSQREEARPGRRRYHLKVTPLPAAVGYIDSRYLTGIRALVGLSTEFSFSIHDAGPSRS